MEFFPEIDVDERQAEAIARGLYAVAKIDGVHERELALIAGFYADAGGSVKALSELERREAIKPDELAAVLHEHDHRLLFVKSALLLAFADGAVSAEEQKIISGYAQALGIAGPDLARLEEGVKEYLLGQLSHLANVDAVRQVARKLKV